MRMAELDGDGFIDFNEFLSCFSGARDDRMHAASSRPRTSIGVSRSGVARGAPLDVKDMFRKSREAYASKRAAARPADIIDEALNSPIVKLQQWMSWNKLTAKAAFMRVDTDGSGNLDPEELRLAFLRSGFETDDASWATIVRSIDTNAN